MRAADVSPEQPATLRRVGDDTEVRVTDPAEYQTLTQTAGYRDVTDAGKKKSGGGSGPSSSSSSSSSGSGSS